MKYFSIPDPCSENWNEMTPTEKGAFCQKCSNEVHDVSQMSNDEIFQLLASEDKVPCMRMKPSQERSLNIDLGLLHQSQKRNMQRAMLFSLLVVFGFTLFSCTNSQQIHERNLLESAANSMIEATDKAQSEVQEKIELNQLKAQKLDLEVEELAKVEDLDVQEKELTLLGEPAIDIVYEGCDLVQEVHIKEVYETMGVPRMIIEKDLIQDVMVTVKKDSENTFSNIPESFSALTFPNPATTHTVLKVELPNNTESLGIRLLDLNGRVLQYINEKPADAGVHEFRIELLDLKPAYYLIDIRYNNEHEVVRLSKSQ